MSKSYNFDARLLKRLAEAADCFRDNLYHYFICKTTCSPTSSYDLHYTAGFENAEDANAEAEIMMKDFSPDYVKFGPYKTTPYFGEEETLIDYDTVEVRFLKSGNEVSLKSFTANNIDAIILSISAYDKFFLPYYIRLYGIEIAQNLRSDAVNALTLPLQSPPGSMHQFMALSASPIGHKSSSPAQGQGGTRHIAGFSEF